MFKIDADSKGLLDIFQLINFKYKGGIKVTPKKVLGGCANIAYHKVFEGVLGKKKKIEYMKLKR